MEVKGSPFSLRIGKDIKETRAVKNEAFKAGQDPHLMSIIQLKITNDFPFTKSQTKKFRSYLRNLADQGSFLIQMFHKTCSLAGKEYGLFKKLFFS
jgi:hypothetical protein